MGGLWTIKQRTDGRTDGRSAVCGLRTLRVVVVVCVMRVCFGLCLLCCCLCDACCLIDTCCLCDACLLCVVCCVVCCIDCVALRCVALCCVVCCVSVALFFFVSCATLLRVVGMVLCRLSFVVLLLPLLLSSYVVRRGVAALRR